MRTALRLIFFCLACVLLCQAPLPGFAADQPGGPPRLIKIVALARHGVRSPTQSAKTLSRWSARTWPQWPVPRGFLTPRGATLVTAMWEDMRGGMRNLGLLPDATCPKPGKIFVRADVDQRTRATAKALLGGLCPEGPLPYAVSTQSPDPLFHPVKAGVQRFDPATVAGSIIDAVGGELDRLHEDNIAQLGRLQQLSAPMPSEMCSRYNLPPSCGLADLPNSVSVAANGKNVRLSGALAVASDMAEIFLLEYAQWPGSPAAWGQVDERTLHEILPLRASVFNAVNRAPEVARARGASLLSEMSAALEGTHRDQRCNAASLVVFVGHDTNIANVGGLLGVHWQMTGYPKDAIPPGAVLCLELWQQGDRREVRVRFFAQTPASLHAPFDEKPSPATAEGPASEVLAAARLTDPARTHKAAEGVVTAPPVVGEARFALEDFEKRVADALQGASLAPQEVPPLRLQADDDMPPFSSPPARDAAPAKKPNAAH